MPNFVIISTYTELYLAEMAKASLEDAGIKVYLADTELAGNQWFLGTAVGGVKVQVAEEDADRAVLQLREFDQGRVIDEEELAREAMEAPTEDEWIAAQTVAGGGSDPESPDTSSDREKHATRALWWMVGGLVFAPAWAVGMFYVLSATFRSGPLSPSARISLRVAGVLAAVTTLIVVLTMSRVWRAY